MTLAEAWAWCAAHSDALAALATVLAICCLIILGPRFAWSVAGCDCFKCRRRRGEL